MRQYKILYPHRPHEQQVDGEGGDEEDRGQVEELGALIDQTSRVSDIDKSKHCTIYNCTQHTLVFIFIPYKTLFLCGKFHDWEKLTSNLSGNGNNYEAGHEN